MTCIDGETKQLGVTQHVFFAPKLPVIYIGKLMIAQWFILGTLYQPDSIMFYHSLTHTYC
jgi:hypothetical protein